MATESSNTIEDSQDTLSTRFSQHTRGHHRILKASILWHPDRDLIGHALPIEFDSQQRCAFSRHDPLFSNPTGREASTLAWAGVSRQPVVLEQQGKALRIIRPNSRMTVRVNGQAMDSSLDLTQSQLKQGFSLSLGEQVILWVQHSQFRRDLTSQDHPFLGISDAAIQVRQTISQFAPTAASVLIRGETGTGKELVAQQLHALSDRADAVYLSLNMATLNESLAAAELFGALKGSFTGAHSDKLGLFQAADNGTLFLDEIGDTPQTVQPMLLRALEAGEIRPVGSQQNQTVDVRIIAATDRTLDRIEGEEDGFNQPLLRRLESLQINIPPLRDRMADLGVLLRHFLIDLRQTLDQSSSLPLDTLDVHALLDYPWPGNVRELRHRLQAWYLTGELELPAAASTMANPGTHNRRQDDRAKSDHQYRNPKTITDDELVSALDDSGWLIKPAAEALNISRTSFYGLMSNCPVIRTIEQIDDKELNDAWTRSGGDLGDCARRLRVARERLKQRVNDL